MPPVAALAAALSAHLGEIGAALATRSAPPAPVADGFDGFQHAMAEMRRDGITRALSGEEVERVFGLSFALEQIRGNLDDLAGHASDLALPGTAAVKSRQDVSGYFILLRPGANMVKKALVCPRRGTPHR